MTLHTQCCRGVLPATIVLKIILDAFHCAVHLSAGKLSPKVPRSLPPGQGHHQRPWTITEREFCNNMHKLFRPASFFAAGLAGMAAGGAPALWDIW